MSEARSPRTGRRRGLVSALALAAALAGCSDLTAGWNGEAEVWVHGDAPPSVEGAAAVDASVTVAARVYLRTGFGDWEELTLGTVPVTVSAAGGSDQLLARRFLRADVYSGVRVVFTSVEADVRSGVVVDGVPVLGEVLVAASAQDPVEIELPLSLVVEEDGVAGVLIDLNAPVWLRAASTDGTVDPAAFRAAVQITLR